MAVRYYRPKNVTQFDGSTFAGLNCTMASGATLLDRHTLGARKSTGAKMRNLQTDFSGGTDLNDLQTSWRRGYSQELDLRYKIPWNDLVVLIKNGHAVVLQMWYGAIPVYYRFQKNMTEGHAIHINEIGTMRDPFTNKMVPAGLVEDPLAKHGEVRWWPLSVLRKSAGYLRFASGNIVGLGYAYAGLARRVGVYSAAQPTKPVLLPGSVPTLVLTKPPTPKEVNPMIPGGGLIRSSSHVMTLKKGQPLYKTPGGALAATMSADATVEYFGTAGPGWRCVEVSTGSVYADKVKRPTLVYVPMAAGPVTKK